MRLCVLTRREVSGGYMAVCPSLPLCVSRARTHRQVLARHRNAILEYLSQSDDTAGDSGDDPIEFDVVNERKIAVFRRMCPGQMQESMQ
ncbi:MAG: hypothetical protein ABFD92_18805 [Planctomycetaceae bacterium]|nr:hypothetical protein [Planctomycetaceae bacterium]